MTKQQYFGTDGIRGRFGDACMNPDFIKRLGFAAGQVFSASDSARVLIGKDTRESCDVLETALCEGLTAAGAHVELLGVLPTPAVAHLTKTVQATAGIMISASHNPHHDNGIKFFNQHGMKLNDAQELAIEAAIKACVTVPDTATGTVKTLQDAKQQYEDFCQHAFPASLSSLTIVVDCANGACVDSGPEVLSALGAHVIAIHNQPDGKNINQDCGATSLASLQKQVLADKADVGVAFDGDGDRLMMVDAHGEVVDGDELLCILALSQNPLPQGIVGTLMSNLGLEQALKAKAVEFVRAKVGDRYVLETLLEKGWTLGGEGSGHIINLACATTGDGLISALHLLNIMVSTQKPLHVLRQLMIKRPQVLINVRVEGEKDTSKFPAIVQAVKTAEDQLCDTGRVLLRPSGTEPLIRVMVEGNDLNNVQAAAQAIADVVQQEMGA